jgi:anti-sigma B factor antagonist
MTKFEISDLGEDLAIIRVEGRLNMVSAPGLRDAVAEAITAGKARLVVDLALVEFMDSSGLGALIGALKTARRAGGDLRIAAPNEQVTLVLELSNVDRILTPYEHADSAFAE